MTRFSERIVCLTEETTETLYLLGLGDRIVGVSGYTVRPPEARAKPKVSAFISARFEAIEQLTHGRARWGRVSAVQHDRIFEVKSTYILQPGPASLTEGVRQLHLRFAQLQDGA